MHVAGHNTTTTTGSFVERIDNSLESPGQSDTCISLQPQLQNIDWRKRLEPLSILSRNKDIIKDERDVMGIIKRNDSDFEGMIKSKT